MQRTHSQARLDLLSDSFHFQCHAYTYIYTLMSKLFACVCLPCSAIVVIHARESEQAKEQKKKNNYPLLIETKTMKKTTRKRNRSSSIKPKPQMRNAKCEKRKAHRNLCTTSVLVICHAFAKIFALGVLFCCWCCCFLFCFCSAVVMSEKKTYKIKLYSF